MILFCDDVPLQDTMIFESAYSNGLKMNIEDKREVMMRQFAVWMLLNNQIIGEIYGIPVNNMREQLPGITNSDHGAMYCYSLTILKRWQGSAYGAILLAHWLGLVKGSGYHRVIAHCRPGGSQALVSKFGGVADCEFPNWYDSGETYRLFRTTL